MPNERLFTRDTPPRHIAIEGPIGVGKSTLAKRLAESLNYTPVFEQAEENPFLEQFYSKQANSALATQLFFLFQRVQQLDSLGDGDLFSGGYVADYLFAKDPLFASITLDSNELALYRKVYEQLAPNPPPVDLVIYLQAPVKVLRERVIQRGVRFERHISGDYLEALNEAYSEFFLRFDSSPLVIVNAAEIDFAHNEQHYQQLLEYLLDIRGGRHYFNPTFF